jgi:hypothetical protein
VRNQRRNFINVRVRPDYATLLFQFKGTDDVRYCFLLSDKLEPFVIITVLCPRLGKLRRLKRKHVGELHAALDAFRQRFGIADETYHYTSLSERDATEAFAASGQVSGAGKAHSAHFHLKMRIATGMYRQRFPVLQLFDFDKLRAQCDHVRHNYARETLSWEQVRPLVEADAEAEDEV